MVLSNLRSESDLKKVEEMRVSLTAALSDLQFKISDEEQRATAFEDALSARLRAADTKQAEVAARLAEEVRQLGQASASEGGALRESLTATRQEIVITGSRLRRELEKASA